MSALAQNINRLMREKAIDRETLSKKAGMSKYTLRNILLEKTRGTSVENVNSLAKALGVTADYLLNGDPRVKERFSSDEVWDGVLYAQAMSVVQSLFERKSPSFNIQDGSTRQKMMSYAEKLYLYAKRQKHQSIDPVLAEVIIDGAV